MHKHIFTTFQALIDELEGFLEMFGHLVGGDIVGIDGFMFDE